MKIEAEIAKRIAHLLFATASLAPTGYFFFLRVKQTLIETEIGFESAIKVEISSE